MSRTPFETEVILSILADLIHLATVHQGGAFGGFVRDVIVPRVANPNCPVEWKDLDLWLPTSGDAEAFKREAKSRLGLQLEAVQSRAIPADHPGNPYPFARDQYRVLKYGTMVTFLDLIVAPKLPVNDFDVNQLLAIHKGQGHYVFEGPGRLISQILQKSATMLPSYLEHLIGKDRPQWHRDLHLDRLIRRYPFSHHRC